MFMKSSMAVVLLALFGISQAQTMCPGTYAYINVGQTMEEVRAKCGAPTTEEKRRDYDKSEVEVEQWVYNVDWPKLGEGPRQMLEFTFQDDKVINISMDGTGWTESDRCKGNTVKMGDTKASVRYACGSPTFTNTGKREEKGGLTEFVFWTYNFGPYTPQLRLEFKKGVLSNITQVQP